VIFYTQLCVKDEWKVFIQRFVLFAVIQRKTKAWLWDIHCAISKRLEFATLQKIQFWQLRDLWTSTMYRSADLIPPCNPISLIQQWNKQLKPRSVGADGWPKYCTYISWNLVQAWCKRPTIFCTKTDWTGNENKIWIRHFGLHPFRNISSLRLWIVGIPTTNSFLF
jgi:hypothetical protein